MRILTLLMLIFVGFISPAMSTVYTISNQNGDWQSILMAAGVPNPLNITAADTVRLFDCNITINGLTIENNGRIEFISFGSGSTLIENNSGSIVGGQDQWLYREIVIL